MEKLMLILNLMAVLGIPTIFALVMAVVRKLTKYSTQIKVLMAAQQAQMRSQLLKDYYTYTKRGYVLESELEDWESQYQAYHSLGANGILDSRREVLMKLEARKEVS